MKVPPDHWCDWKHCELDGDESKPGKPVQLSEKLQVQLTLLDEAVCVDDEEESEGDVQVEGDVRYGHQATPDLWKEIIMKNKGLKMRPDQEKNPAGKQSVSISNFVQSSFTKITHHNKFILAKSAVDKGVHIKIFFVKRLFAKISGQQNCDRDAD